MSFIDIIRQYDPQDVRQRIESATGNDVDRALAIERPGPQELMALLSPAAEEKLETLANKAHQTTLRRFGRTILLYAPLYLSNVCQNGCLYCGFSAENSVPRKTLTDEEILADAKNLHDQGFRHILLLTGEAKGEIGVDFLENAVRLVRPWFSSIGLEVFPMAAEEYRRLIDAGVDALTIYQETYDESLYAELHPYGQKRDYAWRLATPERGGEAGLRRIGIGALLGLGDFRLEGFYTGLHALYLAKRFWRSQITVSFPRLRPADGGFQPLHPVSDRNLVQLICTLRLLIQDAGLVLSTRESAQLRDNLLPLGITQMSAGSCTAPGGYASGERHTEQFAIDDDRSPADFAAMLRDKGYDPVWKDWDGLFLTKEAEQAGTRG